MTHVEDSEVHVPDAGEEAAPQEGGVPIPDLAEAQQVQVDHTHAEIEPTKIDTTHIEPAQIQVQVETTQVEVEPAPVDSTLTHAHDHEQVEPAAVDPSEHQHVEPQAMTIEQEVHLLRDSVRILQEQNEQLQHENATLKRQLGEPGAGGAVGVDGLPIPSEHDTAATAAAAAQLSNYQNALALSETQKQQLANEIQALRNKLTSLGYTVAEGVNIVSVKDGDASATAAAAQIDITEAEALMAIDQTGAAAAHHQATNVAPLVTHQHSHVHVQHPTTPGGSNEVNVLTPNTAGLSSRSEEKWEMHFVRLSQYKAQHGNCLVPTSTELGRWLCRQRHNYRYKSLKEDRRHRLMELDKTCLGERVAELASPIPLSKDGEGVIQADGTSVEGGNPNPNDAMPALNSKTKYNQAYESKLHAKWDRYFQELVAYNEKHGHCNFPTMNGSLGRWISRQRTLYRSKKLKSDRYEKLKNLGFAFEDATALEFKGKLDLQWESMFEKLLEHKARKGHCFDVPETWPLGKWLYRQRWLYRHGNLREDRAKKLLDIGFEDKKVLKKDSGIGRKKRKRGDDGEDVEEDDTQKMEMQEEHIVAPPQETTNGELEHHVVTEDVATADVPAPVGTDESTHPPAMSVPPLPMTDTISPTPVAADETAPATPTPVATDEAITVADAVQTHMTTDETAPVAMEVEKPDEAVVDAAVNAIVEATEESSDNIVV